MCMLPFTACLCIGSRAIFLVGGSSCETKIAEGIRDAKNHCFVLYIAFAGKNGGTGPSPLALPSMFRR